MFIVKFETIDSPDFTCSIGLKNNYKEFDGLIKAFNWIFSNKYYIDIYEIYEAIKLDESDDGFMNSDIKKSFRILYNQKKG